MYCNQCGSEILPGAAFCAKCGHPVQAGPDVPDSAAEPAGGATGQPCAVTFVREKQWFAINPKVKIVVDDRDEYRIENGQTLRVAMAPGTHIVVFKCGVRNKTIELTVRQDLVLHLNWNRLTGSLTVR